MLSSRTASTFVIAASVLVLGGAFAFQYLGGYDPCILCIYQRFPYGVTIVLGLAALALALSGRERAVPWLLGLCGVAFTVGGVIAAYHVGVEQHWWRGTEACGASGFVGTTIEELRQHLLEAPMVRCDEVSWSLFGISMAGYNGAGSALLAGASLAMAGRLRRSGGGS